MATKVKGEAIKEGSIPLSAFNDEVRDMIENVGGGATPDWNAQEGEAGYIENKPFNDNINNKFDFSAWDAKNESNTVITITDTEASCCIAIKYEEYDFDNHYLGQRVILCNLYNGPSIYKIQLNGAGVVNVIITYNFDNTEFIIEFNGIGLDFEYDLKNNIWYGVGVYDFSNVITPIDSTYLRDIVKTTPQSLSDEDKNQALANLGIDPVVWKHMMNPIRLVENVTIVPEELIGEKINHSELGEVFLFKYLIPQMYNIINIDIHRSPSIVGPTNNDYETIGFWAYDIMIGCYINAEHKMVTAEIPF